MDNCFIVMCCHVDSFSSNLDSIYSTEKKRLKKFLSNCRSILTCNKKKKRKKKEEKCTLFGQKGKKERKKNVVFDMFDRS